MSRRCTPIQEASSYVASSKDKTNKLVIKYINPFEGKNIIITFLLQKKNSMMSKRSISYVFFSD